VVDSRGAQIGPYYPPEVALRKINGLWLPLPVLTTGFSNTGVLLNYTSSDCSGTAYLFQNPADLANVQVGLNIGVVNGVLYYGDAAVAQSMAMNSERLLNPDGTPEQPCTTSEEFNPFSPAITLDLSTLGFTPPFTIQVSGMK
jgi:hypothetical protein